MRKAVAKVSRWQWLASRSTDRSLERALARLMSSNEGRDASVAIRPVHAAATTIPSRRSPLPACARGSARPRPGRPSMEC